MPYEGPSAGRGPRRTSGRKLADRHIPDRYLKATPVAGPLPTRLDQAPRLHTEVAQALKVVLRVKTNLQTHARAQGVLFSRDLAPPSNRLKDDDCLRCQLEFNCRDAKQDGGLEDFMTITATAVTPAAPLSVFMGTVSDHCLRDVRQSDPACSLLDLKARCRADKYVTETINMLPEKPAPVFWAQIFTKIAGRGRIHAGQPSVTPL